MAKSTEISLNCVVKEKPIEGQFSIKIDKNDFICDFQDAIKENRKDISIKLWSVDIDPTNEVVLKQLQNVVTDKVESVTGGIRII